jgi:hypothetical protein
MANDPPTPAYQRLLTAHLLDRQWAARHLATHARSTWSATRTPESERAWLAAEARIADAMRPVRVTVEVDRAGVVALAVGMA